MNETSDTPVVPIQSTSTQPQVSIAAAPAPTSAKSHTGLLYLLALLTLLMGIALGYYLNMFLPTIQLKTARDNSTVDKPPDLVLPTDAVRIQTCSENRGALYVRPSDIPVGPIYMVYNSKIIGLEYMLDKEEFLAGKSFSDLPGHNIKVDHVNTGLIVHGHAGYTKPHYHVDMYTVSRATEQNIMCSGEESEMYMEGMDATPSASISPPPTSTTSPILPSPSLTMSSDMHM